MKTESIVYTIVLIVISVIAFSLGFSVGIKNIIELEDAGFKIVKHAVRHGEFTTNWIEVIKKGEAK